MNKCIVILSYNHPELTARTVRSCLKFSWPIILIHNGSNQKNKEKLLAEFSSIDHFIIENNCGFTGGVNKGLTYAYQKYDWAMLLTNDTELLEISNDFDKPAFIAPLIYFRKLGRIDSLGGTFSPNRGKLKHIKEDNYQLKNGEFFYVPGTAFILHKEIFSKIGLLDETLNTYWEDVDFSMRVNQEQLPIYHSSQVKILHKVGKTCHDNPFYTTYLFKRNRKKISMKYAKGFGFIMLVFILAWDYLTTIVRLIKLQDRDRLKLIYKSILD